MGIKISLTSWGVMKNLDIRNARCVAITQEILAFQKELSAPGDQSILEAISSELAAAINQWADGLDLGLKAI